jgi:hypothetical protein
VAVESPQGFFVSNTGIIPAGTSGSIDVYASNPTDIVIDINGYYAPLGGLPGFNTAIGEGALQEPHHRERQHGQQRDRTSGQYHRDR